MFNSAGFYGFQKWLLSSVGSFSKLSQTIERSNSRLLVFFDEIDDFKNALITSCADSWSRIVSSYHRKGWSRDFIRKSYSSSVEDPHLNLIAVGQKGTTKKGL